MNKHVHYPSISGRVVFITGGASGIGRAMVKAFADQGAKIAFIDINNEAAQSLIASLPNAKLWFRQVDVTPITHQARVSLPHQLLLLRFAMRYLQRQMCVSENCQLHVSGSRTR